MEGILYQAEEICRNLFLSIALTIKGGFNFA
jgi:hypothetical protein